MMLIQKVAKEVRFPASWLCERWRMNVPTAEVRIGKGVPAEREVLYGALRERRIKRWRIQQGLWN